MYPTHPKLALLKFHLCEPCDASVGCHGRGNTVRQGTVEVISDGTLPMGRLANAELRKAKQHAHAVFDPIWREHGTSRRDAYRWLAKQLGIPFEQAHIGEFDVATCRRVVKLCAAPHNLKEK